MHGGKADCCMVFGNSSMVVLPIVSSHSLLILSAISFISGGNLGSSLVSSLFSMCLRTSSFSSLVASLCFR